MQVRNHMNSALSAEDRKTHMSVKTHIWAITIRIDIWTKESESILYRIEKSKLNNFDITGQQSSNSKNETIFDSSIKLCSRQTSVPFPQWRTFHPRHTWTFCCSPGSSDGRGCRRRRRCSGGRAEVAGHTWSAGRLDGTSGT